MYSKDISPFITTFFFDESKKHPLLQERNQLIVHDDINYQQLLKEIKV
jgi:hypothetical protein